MIERIRPGGREQRHRLRQPRRPQLEDVVARQVLHQHPGAGKRRGEPDPSDHLADGRRKVRRWAADLEPAADPVGALRTEPEVFARTEPDDPTSTAVALAHLVRRVPRKSAQAGKG